ncbi:hypothetical protein Prudu_013199 [Prunus dulcis]|uniref:ZWICHEL kinesin-like calmodulin-binding protein n=1 Tax=Prunus dulcis TaxID=3755 RepID=A0A4Y1REU5_PRUDU|nr:hypothetical protein Prudu_013199 [Prunus dulcis]
MHSLEPSRPADFRQRFLPTQATVSGDTGPNEPPHFPLSACPSSASIRHCSSRELPRNRPGPTVFSKICGSSFSFVSQPNRSSKAPGARQKCKRDLRGVEAVEVRGIHHRANYSFRAKVKILG